MLFVPMQVGGGRVLVNHLFNLLYKMCISPDSPAREHLVNQTGIWLHYDPISL